MPITKGEVPKQILHSHYLKPLDKGVWKGSLASPLNTQTAWQHPIMLWMQEFLRSLSMLTVRLDLQQMTAQLRPTCPYSYVKVFMSVRWEWGCRARFGESYSVSVTSIRGERNRLCTAESAQEGSVLAVKSLSCSAKGSKQGIDQLLLHYTCSHDSLHASFQSVIKLHYQFTVLVFEAVIQSKALCTSLELQSLGGNKCLPAVTPCRIKTLAFFCLSWLCDAFSWGYEDDLLWFHTILFPRNQVTGLCCVFLLFLL